MSGAFLSRSGFDGSFALVLSGIFGLILLAFAALPAVGGSSEAREIQVVSLMYRGADWFLPLRNGEIPSKPPLLHWFALMVSLIVAGVSAVTVRSVSVFFSGLLCFLTMQLGAIWFQRGVVQSRSERQLLSFLIFIVLSSTYGFVKMSMDARVDMVLTFFTSAAIFSGIYGLIERNGLATKVIKANSYLFWILCGCAVLSKGPVGLILPVAVVAAVNLWISGTIFRFDSVLRPSWGYLLFVILVVPWYLLAFFRFGYGFVEKQLIFENILRFIGGPQFNHQPWWYYFKVVLLDSFPWSLIVIGLVVSRCYRKWFLNGNAQAHTEGATLSKAMLIWLLVGFFVFSLMAGKRGSYLLPLWPAFAIFVSAELLCSIGAGTIKQIIIRAAWWCRYCGVVILAVLFTALELLRLPFNWRGSWRLIGNWASSEGVYLQSVLVGAIFLVFLLVVIAGANYLFRAAACYLVSLVALIAVYVGVTAVKYDLKGFDGLASSINRVVPRELELTAVLGVHDEFLDPLFLYLNRDVLVYRRSGGELPESPYLLVRLRHWQEQKTEQYQKVLSIAPRRDRLIGRLDRSFVVLKRVV